MMSMMGKSTQSRMAGSRKTADSCVKSMVAARVVGGGWCECGGGEWRRSGLGGSQIGRQWKAKDGRSIHGLDQPT